MQRVALLVSFLLLNPITRAEEPCDVVPISKALPARITEAPPKLGQENKVTPLGCTRIYTLGDETFRLDPYHAPTAENLRAVLAPYPDAISHLNRYQSNLKKANVTAYTGTVGLLALITGFVVSGQLDSRPELANTLKWTLVASGLSIAVGSFVIGFTFLQNNQSNLDRATEAYNQVQKNTSVGLSIGKEFR